MSIKGICPACTHQVEWTTVAVSPAATYRCNNCWNLVDRATLDKLEQLAADVAAHDEKRAKLFESLR
jgi:uncharacterized Zn finger protein